jgi:excisionase family DNA binding protein
MLTSGPKVAKIFRDNFVITTGESMAGTATSPADIPRPFTVEQVKEITGFGLNQTYDAIRRGEIPSIRVGRRILVPRKAFLAWLDGDGPNAT